MKKLLMFATVLALSAALAKAQVATDAPAAAPGDQLAAGKQVYMLTCVACHQPNGMGLPMVFPPLTKSEYVGGIPERVVAMILKGNAGPMVIDGKTYNNIMPPQEAILSDDKIAAVASFVRANFGNAATPISPELVKATRAKFAERKTPWSEAELKAWKE